VPCRAGARTQRWAASRRRRAHSRRMRCCRCPPARLPLTDSSHACACFREMTAAV
jgi:hypothetical protein